MEDEKMLVPGPITTSLPAMTTQSGLAAFGTADNMRAYLEHSEAIRNVIQTFVQNNFIQGVDYGMADERSKKESLLKPGAEKICVMFNCHPEFHMDVDTYEMLGRPAGVVCYICKIIDNVTGRVVGEGRGSEKVGNKSRDANKAIKIAEKCSLVDAALYTFMLSDRFTQDGGAGKVALNELKQQLITDVGEIRAGVESGLSDIQWVIMVSESELHKKRIETMGEFAHIRKVVFEDKAYDLQNAEKKRK